MQELDRSPLHKSHFAPNIMSRKKPNMMLKNTEESLLKNNSDLESFPNVNWNNLS